MDTVRSLDVYGIPLTVLDDPCGDYSYQEIGRREWKPELFATLDRFLKPGHVVVDVGAFIGMVSLYAVAKGCGVWAFEPDHVAYRVLVKNVSLNTTPPWPVQCSPYALTDDYSGRAALFSRKGFGSSMSGLSFHSPDCVESIPVGTVRLAEYWNWGKSPKPRIDFLKVNAQGSEARVLRGALPLLEEWHPTIHIYIRPANNELAQQPVALLTDLLTALRYKHVYHEDGTEIALDVLLTPEYLQKHDYKIVVTDRAWS
jgi:FkbM family methyltransferase